jgi:hypothetical protein
MPRSHRSAASNKEFIIEEEKKISWRELASLMLSETISLGILSLPWSFAQLGTVLACILQVSLGVCGTYTGKIYGDFAKQFPEAVDFPAVGRILVGKKWEKWGDYIFYVVFVVVIIFIMAAHVLSFQKMMITLTGLRTCTIWWALIGTAIQFLFSMPREMGHAAKLSISSTVAIFAAIMIVMIATGVQMAENPRPGAFETDPNSTLSSQLVAVMNMVLAYSGHIAYPSFTHELEDPNDFSKALVAQSVTACALYAIFSCVFYNFVGAGVAGLALDSAPRVPAQVSYGICGVTIVMGGVVNAHILGKFVNIRFFPRYAESDSTRAHLVWYCILIGLWAAAFVLAISVPSFQHMLSLVGALFQSFISYGLPALMWWKMQEPGTLFHTWKRVLASIAHFVLFLSGVTLMILGLFGVSKEFSKGNSGKSMSCESNLDVLDNRVGRSPSI